MIHLNRDCFGALFVQPHLEKEVYIFDPGYTFPFLFDVGLSNLPVRVVQQPLPDDNEATGLAGTLMLVCLIYAEPMSGLPMQTGDVGRPIGDMLLLAFNNGGARATEGFCLQSLIIRMSHFPTPFFFSIPFHEIRCSSLSI